MYKVKSSSLVESVLSLALISIVIVVSTMIITNISTSFYNRALKLEVLAKVDSLRIEVEQGSEVNFNRREIKYKKVSITIDIEKKGERLFLLDVLAEKNRKKMLDRKYLIINDKH